MAEAGPRPARKIIFTNCDGVIVHHKILVFVTPVTSFYINIRNQDLLLADIRILQSTA